MADEVGAAGGSYGQMLELPSVPVERSAGSKSDDGQCLATGQEPHGDGGHFDVLRVSIKTSM